MSHSGNARTTDGAKKAARRAVLSPGVKLRGERKVRRAPALIAADSAAPPIAKPPWLRVKLPTSPRVAEIKRELRRQKLHTVCEEAQCPNLGECFGGGTATFMIMGDICTRRCPFCDVSHGRPLPLDEDEPAHLAQTVRKLALRYVVITSVNRDDMRDGGAGHFARCIREVRRHNPGITIEILTPDFRNRLEVALEVLADTPPDVLNHNLETVPSLYRKVRPGANYRQSLQLLRRYRQLRPQVKSKSGLMLGLGEGREELLQTLRDLRACGTEMLTLGQYLQPSRHHLPVSRFVPPEEFEELGREARAIGFEHVASGPLVRSSYHAESQHGIGVHAGQG